MAGYGSEALIPLLAAATAFSAVRIEITPSPARMDEVVRVRVTGLPPQQRVTLRARLQEWRSHAAFLSGSDGIVDVSRQAPLEGTYTGLDPMGLFWSMAPDSDGAFLRFGDLARPVVTMLEAEVDGRAVAQAELTRRILPPHCRRVPVRENGLAAVLFEPAAGGPRPGVIVLGGSEGGFPAIDAALLAAHGYAALALAYFGVEGLPPALKSIPLEYFKKAIDWMRARGSARLAILGGSRGAEAALLVAATYPEIRAVVATAPSHVVWQGTSARGLPSGSSWTSGGKPLAYVPYRYRAGFALRYLLGRKQPLAPMFRESLEGERDVERATIPVERINGPVLLISGKDDQVWPSSWMGERAAERLRRHGRPVLHLSYEGAGHPIPSMYKPLTVSKGLERIIGGTPAGTARSMADSWPKVLAFLEQQLSPPCGSTPGWPCRTTARPR